MRNVRTLAAVLAALVAVSACSKKAPETAPAPVNADSVAKAHAADSAAQAQAAAAAAKRRADSIARAPADSAARVAAVAAAKSAALRAEVATTIYFEFDQSALTDTAKKLLDRKIAILNANPKVAIQIEGHADERGASEYNVALGQRRAASVKRYLTQHGIADARITIISYGEEKPVAAGHDETSWSQNRRAEFVITVEGLTNTP